MGLHGAHENAFWIKVPRQTAQAEPVTTCTVKYGYLLGKSAGELAHSSSSCKYLLSTCYLPRTVCTRSGDPTMNKRC